MFKKAASVAFKGETRLRGKEAKKLRDALAARLGGEAGASALLPSKADVVVRKVGGGSNVAFVFVDGECFLVQPDGRAAIGDAELVPTLLALWKAGVTTLLPCVLIQRPVAKFVFGGANVMAPGIHSVLLPEGDSLASLREGSLVGVRAIGNHSACAVGRLRMPAESLGARGVKGEAVEVLHYFGDALWEACGSPRPTGFEGNHVCATDEGEEEARLLGNAAPAEAEAPTPAAEDGAIAAEDVEVKVAEERGDDEAAAEEKEGAVEESAASASSDAAATPEAMTRALEECFLQAAKTRLKDKDLPIPGNTLYSTHMRPCRRAGSHVDVKACKQKKLGAFLAHLEELGWLALKKNTADPVVTRIFRDHPDVHEWRPWPRSATAEAASDAEGAGGAKNGTALATVEVQPVWNVKKLASLIQALGPTSAAPEDGCWSRPECTEALRQYADSRSLWQKNNRKRVGLDSLLLGLIGEAAAEQASGGGHSLEGLTDRVLGSLPQCHRVAAPQGGAVGGIKRTVRPGKPPVVQVRTDTRRGHSVTLVHGLEAYGVDMEAFAACLQKALASSATVESEPQVAVMVQGFWDVAVVEWLGKIGIPNESIQHQAKKGQSQKKAKQASNIVRG